MNPLPLQNLHYDIGGLSFEPTYLQAAAIVGLLFVLVLTLARLRRLFMNWSLSGWYAWMAIGFVLTVVLEGFLLVGGRTILTELLGWENAPKPVQIALESGREKLVNVLGVTEEIPSSLANEPPTAELVLQMFESLDASDAASVTSQICSP
ncbi:hypothetical protein A2630_01600 [Candidatus Woesebacteria bacterium RIFCSPHIGHO2_01_FULL_44_10]|uniref:Uncharacterized protein n=1 Tax=Candidatus Woesebacteria bacterium RIFCSPLOWO2_01_FULL_44_14 TaxID=1802525 RepID=A0A1F8C3U8_9BACT|nr:MAG: hypothetical protein A2630_01600 [Candidatus Woesebacteria bacterium RIFCSPHIGHO2_01_FULL_44_10]OGM54948.1 MAG: hypothetical protein A3F62_00900 [Candidatus Woesebacteria bacterium RIFCSPHIGHO2_12_FULL_44_11]OGM70335.1 MAG: hypothetical protein A2975_04685 [Candidatus Woesebacteria bacterium RIFCSPLOWO2_01_FULL_44_14]